MVSETKLRDLSGGVSILLFGLFTTVYATTQLPVGTMNAADAGLFPAGVGIVLIVIGAVLIVRALFSRSDDSPTVSVDWQTLALITLAVVVFAFGFMLFGLVPAIFCSTLVASLADKKLSLRKACLLGVFLAVLCAVVFRFVLGMYIPLFDNPFGG